jgi:hypothetical protein
VTEHGYMPTASAGIIFGLHNIGTYLIPSEDFCTYYRAIVNADWWVLSYMHSPSPDLAREQCLLGIRRSRGTSRSKQGWLGTKSWLCHRFVSALDDIKDTGFRDRPGAAR